MVRGGKTLTGRKDKGRLKGLTAKSFAGSAVAQNRRRTGRGKGLGVKTAQRVHGGLELEREARAGDSIHKTKHPDLYSLSEVHVRYAQQFRDIRI